MINGFIVISERLLLNKTHCEKAKGGFDHFAGGSRLCVRGFIALNNIVFGLGGKNRLPGIPKTNSQPILTEALPLERLSVQDSFTPSLTASADADSIHFEGKRRGKKNKQRPPLFMEPIPLDIIQTSEKKVTIPTKSVPSGTKLEAILTTNLLTLTGIKKDMTGLELLGALRELTNRQAHSACHAEDLATHLGTNSQTDKYRLFEALRALESAGLVEPSHRDDAAAYDLWKEWSFTGFGKKMLFHSKSLTVEQYQHIEQALDQSNTATPLKAIRSLAALGKPNATGHSLHAMLTSPAAQIEDKIYTGLELLQYFQKYVQGQGLYSFSSWDAVTGLEAHNEFEKGAVYATLRKLHAYGLIDKVGNAKSTPGQEWHLTRGAKTLLNQWANLSAKEVDAFGSLFEGSKDLIQRAEQRANERLEKIESTIKSLLSAGKEGHSSLELLKRFPEAEKARSGWSRFFHKGISEKELFKNLNFRDPAALREHLETLETLGLIVKNNSNRYEPTDRGEQILSNRSTDPLKVLGIHHEDVRQVIRLEVSRLNTQKAEKNNQYNQLMEKNAAAQEAMKQKEDEYEAQRQAAIESYDRSQTITNPTEKHKVETETSEKILKADMLRQEAHEAKQWARQLKREVDAAKLLYNESIRLMNQSILKLNRTVMALDRSQSNESVAALKQSLQAADPHEKKDAPPTITSMVHELLYRKTGTDDALDVDDAALEADHVASSLVEQETMSQRIAEMRKEVAQESNPLAEAAEKANVPGDNAPKTSHQVNKDTPK